MTLCGQNIYDVGLYRFRSFFEEEEPSMIKEMILIWHITCFMAELSKEPSKANADSLNSLL